MEIPNTHYAASGDLLIAYQVHGSGEHDVLLSAGPASNVETVWSLPEEVRLFERLGRFGRVILLDRRDTGISDSFRDPAPVSDRVLASVLFTDLVGSTERASELGDAAWSELLRRHHSSARATVERCGGEMVKTLGDGVLATFTGPAQDLYALERVAPPTADGMPDTALSRNAPRRSSWTRRVSASRGAATRTARRSGPFKVETGEDPAHHPVPGV